MAVQFLCPQQAQATVAAAAAAPVSVADAAEEPFRMYGGKWHGRTPPCKRHSLAVADRLALRLGRTIAEVMERDKSYFARYASQTPSGRQPFGDRPNLRAALATAGLLERVVAEGKLRRSGRHARTKADEASGKAFAFHRERRACHDITLREAAREQGVVRVHCGGKLCSWGCRGCNGSRRAQQ